MATRADRAAVYKNGRLAGTLARDRDDIVFSYTPEYLDSDGPALCTTIPRSPRETRTRGGAVPPFFAGLLPEGRRLTALQSSLKTSPDDEFSQLLAVGRDCIGDVTVLSDEIDTPELPEPTLREPHESSFRELFDLALHRGADDRSPSVPGVQDKLSNQMLSVPVKRAGTTVILKLTPAPFPRLVENEAHFLGLAKACGLRVPNFSILADRDGETALMVERFDRVGRGRTQQKIAQEDAVQLAGRWPAAKYSMTTREVFDAVLAVTPAAPVARQALLRLFTFSYLIGNGDLHGKNVSVFDHPEGVLSVTPAYDLVSTIPYRDPHLALDLEGRDDNITGTVLAQFAARFGGTEKQVRKLITEITDSAEPRIDAVAEIGFTDKQTDHLAREIRRRMSDLRR